MEGADQVLAARMVDRDLPADGAIDHRQQRGRHHQQRQAAVVGGGHEARQVADDAAAERYEMVGARCASCHERAPHPLGAGQRLLLLARRERDRGGDVPEPLAVQRCDGLVGDAEGTRGGAVEGPQIDQATRRSGAEEPATDHHGVLARARGRPQQARSPWCAGERAERIQRLVRTAAHERGQVRVGHLFV